MTVTNVGSAQAGPAPTHPLDSAVERRLRFAYMLLSRRFDERFEALRLAGRLAKWYSAIGNEATTVPIGLALEDEDVLVTLHRDLGAILAYYLDPHQAFPGLGFDAVNRRVRPGHRDPQDLMRRLACQLLGKGEGFSQGVERSFHYGLLDEPNGIRHFGMISHLGSMIPVAAGCAMRMREAGGLAVNFIGDGGTSTGDFHEGLNMAAVWKLPFILVIENNQYAFSTPTNQQFAVPELVERARGYGIAGERVDGNDPDAVAAVFQQAASRARAGEGPTLIEAVVGRMRGHAEGDDSLKVVPEEELRRYLDEDPVPAYQDRLLIEFAADGAWRDRLLARVDELVEDAVDYGLAAEPPTPEIASRPVLAPVVKEFEEPEEIDLSGKLDDGEYYVEGVRRALHDAMEADDDVLVMGQDIAAFEGAFRVTTGLFEKWPDRVLDTPISESGTLGIAAGLALLGAKPVVEMQFADFVSCGFNQIVNVFAKFYYRWGIPCPVVVRLPSGGGVGAGAYHSQNPEGWFAHTAGLKVVCPATAEDAYGLLRASIDDPNPVMFCEHKYLYRRIKGRLPQHALELGRAQILRSGSDLTLVGYGATTWKCVEAAGQLADRGVHAEVVDLRTLVPFDEQTVLASVRKTGRVLIVHEAQLTGGFGGEIAARIADAAFPWLDAPVKRLAYPDRPVPFVKSLERELLPNTERVVSAAEELLAY